jgi:hypothetical protein
VTGLIPGEIQKTAGGPAVFCCINWRGQEGAKTNFSKRTLIGETRFIPAFNLVLDLFRITGYEGEKFLSAVPQPR